MANAKPATSKTDEVALTPEVTQVAAAEATKEDANEEASAPALTEVKPVTAEITEVEGKAPTKPKPAKAKEVSTDFSHGIKRMSY